MTGARTVREKTQDVDGVAIGAAKQSLDEIARRSEESLDTRETLIKNTREIIILCGRSIIYVHSGETGRAANGIKKAKKLLTKYQGMARGELKKHLEIPEQEYVEAATFLSIVLRCPLPSQAELGVEDAAYVMGMFDCIGELKRYVMDNIRRGQIAEGARVFDIMQELYDHLYRFAALDKVIKEARRKSDLARILIEDVRAVITEETRRTELLDVVRAIGT